MAFTGVLTTETECNAMAGENVDATGWTEENKNLWVAQSESYLCSIARYNFVDNYSSLNSDVKKILNEYCARYSALCGILYNMHGYGSTESNGRIHAETMINVHWARMKVIEQVLRDQNTMNFIKGA